jgi:serine/threonine protein kinase
VNEYLQEIDPFDKLGIENKDSLSNHLIPLQLTFRHGRDYYLMFPWADGNLKQFWSQRVAKPEKPEEVCWFIGQCSGIARGLRKIHHLSTELSQKTVNLVNAKQMILGGKEWGRHGDIKPENILWFGECQDKRDHLVISDFGLTRFNSAHSRSKVQQDQIQGFSGTYRPPDLHLEDQPISQNYDVWSLGCVFLEFLSWFLLGYEQTVDVFTQGRMNDGQKGDIREDTFFTFENGPLVTPRKAKLKDSVVEVMPKP